jgi:hypothetical protein
MNQLSIVPDKINLDAVNHNAKVSNGCGNLKFMVYHSGFMQSIYRAENKTHLNKLLNIDLKMGYIISIEKIIEVV